MKVFESELSEQKHKIRPDDNIETKILDENLHHEIEKKKFENKLRE